MLLNESQKQASENQRRAGQIQQLTERSAQQAVLIQRLTEQREQDAVQNRVFLLGCA